MLFVVLFNLQLDILIFGDCAFSWKKNLQFNSLTGSESCLSEEKKEQAGRLFLRKGTDEETMEYVMSGADTVIGLKRQELLFLPDGNLPDDVAIEDILHFSMINGITKVLADIPAKEELPEQYKWAGFNRAYLYRCYQKEDIGNGLTE